MNDENDFEPYSPEEQREIDEWSAARDRVIAFFEKHGRMIDDFGEADVLMVDDMMASDLIEVEITDYSILHPHFIEMFREFLSEIPDYVVTVQISYPGPYREDWPRMGLTLYRGKISDGLKRDYLPAPFNTYFYTNSRPDNRPDLPFV